jgi:high-affinity iron transporter
MFGTGLIVFRETLEAALFIGILAAATRQIEGRTRWLVMGTTWGVMGSLLLAVAMNSISDWASGLGQELVHSAILATAMTMLAWHSMWVSTHARQMTENAMSLGAGAAGHSGRLWAVSLVVAMTVLREGAETVLFVAGLIMGGTEAVGALVIGAFLGLALGATTGWLIYQGLGRVQPRRLFAVTNGLVLLLTGRLASQLAKTLQQAGWIQWLSDQAWDSSSWLTNDSLVGVLLHGLVGFEACPSQLQVLAYALTALLIAMAARQIRLRSATC